MCLLVGQLVHSLSAGMLDDSFGLLEANFNIVVFAKLYDSCAVVAEIKCKVSVGGCCQCRFAESVYRESNGCLCVSFALLFQNIASNGLIKTVVSPEPVYCMARRLVWS